MRNVIADHGGSDSARATLVVPAEDWLAAEGTTTHPKNQDYTHGMTQGSISCPLTFTVYSRFEYGSEAL